MNGRGTLIAVVLLNLVAAAESGAWTHMSADELALRLADAHGGMQRWKEAPTVSFEHTMVSPQEPDDPWVSRDVTEQGPRRSYQDWPLDGAIIAWDGTEVWSRGWKRGNPPRFMVNLAYYLLDLPWLVRDPGVLLTGPRSGRFPTADRDYLTLTMTFLPGVGDSPDDYYVLYIDPDTFRLAACEYVVTYGAMLDLFGLPSDAKFLGPFFKIFDEFDTVDGLLVPVRYRTLDAEGNVYGNHTVKDWSFRKRFDAARLEKPEDAIVDHSSNRRAGS